MQYLCIVKAKKKHTRRSAPGTSIPHPLTISSSPAATYAYHPRDILATGAFTNISLVHGRHGAIARQPAIIYSTSRSARHRPDPNCPKKNAAPAGRKKERLGAMSSRPNRSDVHLSPEDEAAREAEVRGYFDDAAPKRHTKPSRSEHSAVYADAIVPDSTHPELDKFQDLEAHTEVSPLDPRPPQLPLSLEPELLQAAYTYESSPCCVQRLVYEGGKVGEEFVETEYYKDLGGVGKQHHTVTTAGSLRFLPFFRDLGARELQNLLTPLSFLCQYAERADRNRLHQDGQRQGRLVQTVRKPRRSGAPRFLQGEPCHQRVDPIG